MFLTSVSDLVQVITNAASDIEVHASWVDKTAATEPIAGRLNTASITTATTTTIVPAPAANAARWVTELNFHNNHASQACLLRLLHTDGTIVTELIHATLLAGETLLYGEDGDWLHLDANLDDYPSSIIYDDGLMGIADTLAETVPRKLCDESNLGAPTSGTLRLIAIFLRAGQIVSNISFFSATTAAGTPTNGFFALYDKNRNKLAESANFTTEAWAANTIKTKTMVAPYLVRKSDIYYIAIMITATTTPTLKCATARTNGELGFTDPTLVGNSTTGLTTVLPNPAIRISTASTSIPWAAVT